MRQANVCLNRILKVYVKFVSRRLTQTFVLVKKGCDENQKKETKEDIKQRALHTW